MGLDLTVEGRPLTGHEAEWRDLVTRFFNEERLGDAEIERFQQISEPAYATLNAPRVGFDAAADDWIAERLAGQMDRQKAIDTYRGYHAIALIEADGLPKYTHAGLYDGVDETSFRGSFLEACKQVLTNDQITAAWAHRMPGEALRYGRELLAAASRARENGALDPPKRGMLGFGRQREPSEFPLAEEIDIVEAAGRWFIFWGERGHPIRAYF